MEFACGLVLGIFILGVVLIYHNSKPKLSKEQAKEKEWSVTTNDARLRQRAIANLSGFAEADEKDSTSVFSHQAACIQLAATDIFVQKAQDDLEARKKRMHLYALASASAFLVLVAAFVWYMDIPNYIRNEIFNQDKIGALLNFNRVNTIQPWAVVYLTIRSGTLLAMYLFILYILVALFRAFLHEATLIENRMHSIRLGRLFVYLRLSHLNSYAGLYEAAGKISSEDLERVFGWNIETSTAFKDINPELVNRGVISQIASAFAGVVSNKA